MCLSAFPCTLTFCSSSQMHALCAAVITSFCPRQPPLGMWPIVYLGSSPFQLLPLSSCAFLHSVHAAVLLYPYFSICCPHGNVPVTTWSNLLRLCHGIDLFFSHFPISSRLDPSRKRKSVLHVRFTGLPILLWSRSSKHFLPHSCSSLKLPLFEASVPSLDDRCSLDQEPTTQTLRP